MSNFNLYSQYYDLLYRDKDYTAESAYVMDVLGRFGRNPVKELLELGCGSGNHARYFSASGVQVTGIERSPEMVEIARGKEIPAFEPIAGDITSFELSSKFDAAVSLFHVVSYLTSNNDLIRCFKRTCNHLKPGGLFVFDVWFTPAVLTQRPETRIRRMEDDYITVTRLAEPVIHHDTNVVDVNYELWLRNKDAGALDSAVLRESHPMRHFGIPEIELLARQTGFEYLHAEAFLTKESPGPDTWGVCFVLSKRHE
jgi:SAM-dependent methyltransferase